MYRSRVGHISQQLYRLYNQSILDESNTEVKTNNINIIDANNSQITAHRNYNGNPQELLLTNSIKLDNISSPEFSPTNPYNQSQSNILVSGSNSDKQTSDKRTLDKQTSDKQTLDKQTSDKQSSDEQSSDKQLDLGDDSVSGDLSRDSGMITCRSNEDDEIDNILYNYDGANSNDNSDNSDGSQRKMLRSLLHCNSQFLIKLTENLKSGTLNPQLIRKFYHQTVSMIDRQYSTKWPLEFQRLKSINLDLPSSVDGDCISKVIVVPQVKPPLQRLKVQFRKPNQINNISRSIKIRHANQLYQIVCDLVCQVQDKQSPILEVNQLIKIANSVRGSYPELIISNERPLTSIEGIFILRDSLVSVNQEIKLIHLDIPISQDKLTYLANYGADLSKFTANELKEIAIYLETLTMNEGPYQYLFDELKLKVSQRRSQLSKVIIQR